jgi:O-antigen/teichoic acid export membrane protein
LSRDEIRVQYSGFIIFAAQILSVVTGIIFTLLLTRNMTKPQYGIWSNIFDFAGYFTLLSGLFPFWATRFVAREKEGAIKTGLFANLIVALVSVIIYLPLISLVTSAFQVGEGYIFLYLIASLQIINVYMISILESCLRAVKPQTIGYGLLIEEVCKVSLAYILIVGFHQLFLGAMLSLIIAASIEALYYVRLLAKDLRQRIRWNYLREWLKGSAANFYNAVGNQLVAFVLLLLFIFGGQAARGEYQAAATFANVVGYASFLAFALYPKLLAKNSLEDVALSLKTVLMFAIPMAAIIITMSESLLTILNVFYAAASPILILLTLDTVVLLISQFYSSLLLGIERLDEEAKISFGQLVRSKMFKAFTLPYIQAAIALPTAYYVLTQLATSNSVQAVLYVTTINICVHMTAFFGLYAIMRKSVRIAVPWRSIGKYLFASAVSAAVLYILPHPTTILATLGKVTGGVAFYAALLLMIDGEARKLVALIWHEIKGIFGQIYKRY